MKKITSLGSSSQQLVNEETCLTSLTCFSMFHYNDLLLIADCFPLLKELNLEYPSVKDETNFIHGMHRLLSKSPCIQHLELRRTYFLTDQHVVELSSYMGN